MTVDMLMRFIDCANEECPFVYIGKDVSMGKVAVVENGVCRWSFTKCLPLKIKKGWLEFKPGMMVRIRLDKALEAMDALAGSDAFFLRRLDEGRLYYSDVWNVIAVASDGVITAPFII